MKLKLVHDPKNRERTKKLGDFGENLSQELLKKSGFIKIRNLNNIEENYPFADLTAERGGKKYAISVKTRLKYERLGGLNPKYNLGKDWRRKLEKAVKNEKAIPSWLAIQVDEMTYSAYFGLISLVEESNGIPMQPEALPFYERLAEDEKHGLNWNEIKPNYHVIVEGKL